MIDGAANFAHCAFNPVVFTNAASAAISFSTYASNSSGVIYHRLDAEAAQLIAYFGHLQGL